MPRSSRLLKRIENHNSSPQRNRNGGSTTVKSKFIPVRNRTSSKSRPRPMDEPPSKTSERKKERSGLRPSSSQGRDSRSAERVVDKGRTKSASGPCTNDQYRSRSHARSREHSERSPSCYPSASSGPSSRKHSRERSLSSSSAVSPREERS